MSRATSCSPAATGRAFITTAHRGQQRTDASIASAARRRAIRNSRRPASVAPMCGCSIPRISARPFGGTPLKILIVLQRYAARARRQPRSQDRFMPPPSNPGNQTTTVFELMVCDGFDPNTPCSFAGNTLPGGAIPAR